jgi:Protein of unknown function (DUF4199)
MKHALFYGFISALISALYTLGLYFTGFHSSVAKLDSVAVISPIIALAVSITCMVLGARAVGADTPPDEDFGYGRALLASFGVSVISTVLYGIFNFCYVSWLNPDIIDLMVQQRVIKMQNKGISGAQLDNAEAMTRKLMQPIPGFVFVLIFGIVAGLVISLVVAAFVRRKAAVLAAPPLV